MTWTLTLRMMLRLRTGHPGTGGARRQVPKTDVPLRHQEMRVTAEHLALLRLRVTGFCLCIGVKDGERLYIMPCANYPFSWNMLFFRVLQQIQGEGDYQKFGLRSRAANPWQHLRREGVQEPASKALLNLCHSFSSTFCLWVPVRR